VERQRQRHADVLPGVLEVEILEQAVVGAAGGDEDVVDGPGKIGEKLLQRYGIGGVEGGGAKRVDRLGSLLEPILVAAGDGHLGTLGPGQSRRLQAHPGAAAEHHHDLSVELAHANLL